MGNAEQWIQDFYQEDCGCSLEDICGQYIWKKVLRGCIYREGLEDLFETSPFWSLLFYGETGTGKSTLGKAFLGELEVNGYKVLYLRAVDLLREKDEAISRAAQFQKECLKWEKTAIFLDDGDSLGEEIPVAEQLAESLDRLRGWNVPAIWMIAAEKAENIPESLREQMYLCRIAAPDFEERLEYFQTMMGRLTDENGGFRCSHMAEMTEGCNFEQLNRITVFSKAFLKEKVLEEADYNWKTVRHMAEKGRIYIERETFCKIAEEIRSERKETHKESLQELMKQIAPYGNAMSLQQENKAVVFEAGEETIKYEIANRESVIPDSQTESQHTADSSVSLDDELDMLDPSNLDI